MDTKNHKNISRLLPAIFVFSSLCGKRKLPFRAMRVSISVVFKFSYISTSNSFACSTMFSTVKP